jgi:eukaryotic-like serine/threonine-protein kinase
MPDGYAIINSGMLQIGDQFAHFQIQKYMAQGGMSDIYLAFDLVNRREVVLKIPDASMIGDPAQYERFQREMEVVTGLDHPAILRGLETGQYNRTPYLATELVKGLPLRQVMTDSAPMPPERAVELAGKIAAGMAYCHAHGVVHRDLKPENILVTEEGQPVIMDFGLALTKGAHRVTYSNLSATMGTPDYMAPEQIEGQRGDVRTDIYALGTILFEMLCGRPPFSGDNNMAIMAQHLKGTAVRVDNLQPGVPAALAAIVARCLQRDPQERYQTMESLEEALQHPETVDLAILTKTGRRSFLTTLWQSIAVRAVSISALILLAIIAIALALQSLRP